MTAMPQPVLRRIQAYSGPSLVSLRRAALLSVEWGNAAPPAPDALTGYLTALFVHRGLEQSPPPPDALAAIESVAPERRLDRAVAWLAVALQRALGHPVPWAEPRDTDPAPGVVVVPIWDLDLGPFAAHAAFRLLASGVAAMSRAATTILDDFFAAAAPANFGEGQIRVIEAATRRGIPWSRLVPGSELLLLGQGARQVRFLQNYTSNTGFIATRVATNKDIATRLLRDQGLPVPANRRVTSLEAALRAAAAIGFPVVIKPTNTDFGTGVSTGIRDEADLARAYAAAAKHGDVLVEQHIAGEHTRLLVVHGRFVSAVRQDPAQVVGDGRRTVAALIAAINANRTADLSSSFKKIVIDDEARLFLGRQGLSLDSIPADGQKVILRHTSNTSRGGTARNVTARVHPDNARLAERATAVVGLDLAGIDFITPDIERSFREVGGAICEINPSPGFYMREPRHLVEDAVLDGFFAAGDRGRIPLLCLLADDDGAAAALMSAIGARLRASMTGVAVVGPAAVRIDDWLVAERPTSLQRAARIALTDPATRAAIIHLTHRSVAEDGLAFDACDLALTPPLPAHPPDGPAEAVERYRTAALLRAISGEHADPADPASALVRAERIAIAARTAGG
jgi:cyanophycin synthetase